MPHFKNLFKGKNHVFIWYTTNKKKREYNWGRLK